MPTVSSRGARIHYQEHGKRGQPAVVLIQGLGLSSAFWFDVPTLLSQDPERHVVALDNRGTGKSDRPRRPWTMATMADDVANVMDHAGIDRAIVAGISMGGMIAQHVAIRHPSRVEALLLMATTPGFIAGAFPAPISLYRLLSMPFGGPNAGRTLTRLLLPPSKWHRAREIFKDWPSAMRDDPTPTATFAAHLFAASTHLVSRQLASIRCPTIVAVGAADTLVPPRNAMAIAARIPEAELEILADTGHALFAEDRDLVRRLVVRLEERVASKL